LHNEYSALISGVFTKSGSFSLRSFRFVLPVHNQAAAVVAKARGSYCEAVHRLNILSDFYAQIEVKGVEAEIGD
jgi:hypothetical protein